MHNPGSSNVLDNYAREVTARNVVYFMWVKEELQRSMGVRKRSGNHTKMDRSGDVLALVEVLITDRVGKYVAGRGVDVGEEELTNKCERNDPVKIGLERMNNGVWWPEYLMRSPGCARVLKGKPVGVQSLGNIAQYEGDMFN